MFAAGNILCPIQIRIMADYETILDGLLCYIPNLFKSAILNLVKNLVINNLEEQKVVSIYM